MTFLSRLAATLALGLLVAPLAAQDPDRELELEHIRDEIARLQTELGRLRERATGVTGLLARTRLELELQERRVAEAGAARDLVASALTATEQKVEVLERRLEELRGDLRWGLAWLYRSGRQGFLRLFLSIRSRQDLLPGIRCLRYLSRRNAQAFNSFLDTRVRLDFERDQLAAQSRELDGWARREEGRRQELVRLQQTQAELLARLEREREDLSARAARLVDKASKLSSFLDFLYGRTPSALAGTPIQQFRGVLDWPIRGRVVGNFGPRMDVRYKTRVPHNGIDIVTAQGARVRAIFPGKVLFAAPFQGYGLTAVVHHPGRVFSLYAGLGKLLVRQDDMVSLGDVIGTADDTLYFEIREENRPQDPLDWLR